MRWKPRLNEKYYFLGSQHIYCCYWVNDDSDHHRHRNGNCFRSESDAELCRDKELETRMQFHEEFTR
jgi:hypothetical protein